MSSAPYSDQRVHNMQHRPAAHDYQSYGGHVQPQAFVHGQGYPQSVPAAAPVLREPMRGRDSQGRQFALEVAQQPERARMCGYGDKDRRPITPPVCVRLLITDGATGREIDISSLNPAHYVLSVDLFDEHGYTAANLIQQLDRGASSSISAAKPGPYPPQPQWYGGDMGMMGGYMSAPPHQAGGMGAYAGGPWPPREVHNVQQYTRNLIGNVAVSASVLADTTNTNGIWFVLQDLSVRQEGSYRLKFMFTDLEPSLASGAAKPAPILSTIFSEVFQVHSAKKFPGVKESTALSKCFAQQGVKIPIRKEGGKGRNGDDEDEDE